MSASGADGSVTASRQRQNEMPVARTAGGKEVPGMKKITIRKTGPIKLTAPAFYDPFGIC